MKGKVFIGWTKTNDIAYKVKDMLDNYTCYVGGDDPDNKNIGAGQEYYVGSTVIKQMNNCNQAIFIISKYDKALSNNVMFELGYTCAKFRNTGRKIHVFYLDVPSMDNAIPSDLVGMWAEHMETYDLSNDEIAKRIVSLFLKRQMNEITENKMMVIDKWYKIENEIANHNKDPQCSDFELAQYLLFYSHAAYIFDFSDAAFSQVRSLCEYDSLESEELSIAINIALLANGAIYRYASSSEPMSGDVYDDIFEKYQSIQKSIGTKHETDGEFYKWAYVMALDYMNLAATLRLFAYDDECKNAEPDTELYDEYTSMVLETGEKILSLCEILGSSQNNKEFVMLIKAYIFRNIAHVYRIQNDEENEKKYLDLSYDLRAELHEIYENRHIDSRLKDNFEMEYHLIMSELLKYEKTGAKARRYRRKVQNYIEKCQNNSNLISSYIVRMKTLMEN